MHDDKNVINKVVCIYYAVVHAWCALVCARVCVYPCVSIENQAVEFCLPTSFLLPAAGTDNVTI